MDDYDGPFSWRSDSHFTKRLGCGCLGYIKAIVATCDGCGEPSRKCLTTDTSDEEYGAITLCRKCIVKMLNADVEE